jgi:hypothetical protein
LRRQANNLLLAHRTIALVEGSSSPRRKLAKGRGDAAAPAMADPTPKRRLSNVAPRRRLGGQPETRDATAFLPEPISNPVEEMTGE